MPSAAIITLVTIAAVFGGFILVGAPEAEATHIFDPPNNAQIGILDTRYIQNGILTIKVGPTNQDAVWDNTSVDSDFDHTNPHYGSGNARIPVSDPGVYEAWYEIPGVHATPVRYVINVTALPAISLGPALDHRYPNTSNGIHACSLGFECALHRGLGGVTGGLDGDPATVPNDDYFVRRTGHLATCTLGTLSLDDTTVESRAGNTIYDENGNALYYAPDYRTIAKYELTNTTKSYSCTNDVGTVYASISWCNTDPCFRADLLRASWNHSPAIIERVFDGVRWVAWDGYVVLPPSPKLQGMTWGLESVHVTLNGTQVGDNGIGSDGRFTKEWTHAPLTHGSYILEIRETATSDVLWFAPVQIGAGQVRSATVTQVYNGTDWVPFSDGMTLPTSAPKFRGETENLESIHITLNGTNVGGSKLSGDSFWKSWKHDPLADGTYTLEIRESSGSAVLLSATIQIGTGQQQQEPPQQEPPQQEPPQQEPPQQEPPQQEPPQTNSTNTQPPADPPSQPDPPTDPPADPPTPPTPTKSADITLIHDGTDWVSFTDGMTISNDMPKFRGDTEGLGSIYITLDGTQVGGTKVSDTGSFWKSWKHDALNSGTYTVQIREISSSEVLLSVSITIR